MSLCVFSEIFMIKKMISQNQLVVNARRMWPYVKPFWFRAALGVFLTIPVGGLDAAVAMFMKPFMDKVMVDKQPNFSALIPFLIIGFTVVQGILQYSSNYLNTWVANKITIGVKRKLYAKLLSMDSSYMDANNSGTILYRYSNDAETASNGLVENMKKFLSKTFSSIALAGVMIYNSWQLAVIAIAVLGLFFYPIVFVRKKMKEIVNKIIELKYPSLKQLNNGIIKSAIEEVPHLTFQVRRLNKLHLLKPEFVLRYRQSKQFCQD